MVDPARLLPPRKLYEMLRACRSADARVRAALEFLRGSAGSESGFLFQSRDGGLVLAASTRDRPAPPGMLEAVEQVWTVLRDAALNEGKTAQLSVAEAEAAARSTPSSTWTSLAGESFQRRQLGTHRSHRWIGVGLVMLKQDPGQEPSPIRHTHIAAICDALMDAGDVTGA
jgi:hypothetical protein